MERDGRSAECHSAHPDPFNLPAFGILGQRMIDRLPADEALAQAQAAAARFESERRLGALIGQSLVGIAEIGLDGHLRDANERYCALAGYSRAELLQLTLRDITFPEDLATVEASLQALLEGKPPQMYERRYRRKDGSKIYALVTPALLSDARGQPDGFFAVVVDITQRKAQEQALREAERRWQFALEGAEQGVWDWNLVDDTVFFSAQYKRMLGYDDEPWDNSAAAGFARFHPDDMADMQAALDRYLRGETPFYQAQFRVRRKDGSYVWVESRGIVVERDPDGKPTRIMGTHTDITARKRADAELVQRAEAAEIANRAKDAFLGVMSHELRTPLNGIMGMLALIRRHATDPKVTDFAIKADKAAQQLLGVVSDILDITRIEAEQLVLVAEPMRLEPVVRRIVGVLGLHAADKHIALRLELPPDLAHRDFVGDPNRLGQILNNLIGNAIKFTETGAVTIRAALTEDRGSDVLVRFEVQDTGIGIAAGDRSRLFRPFEQADMSLTRLHGGTGLGLFICQRLVNLMGGEIGVESTPGVGSCFWFTVRLKAPTPATDALPLADTTAEATLRQRYTGARVLVVEDEELNRLVVTDMLHAVGMAVDEAHNGEQAVELAARSTYAAILMDVKMPVLDGLEATRRIRRLPNGSSVPIIALTALAFPEDRAQCLAAGMDDYVTKPVAIDILATTLLKWLRPR